jgi:hypothetical protein
MFSTFPSIINKMSFTLNIRTLLTILQFFLYCELNIHAGPSGRAV